MWLKRISATRGIKLMICHLQRMPAVFQRCQFLVDHGTRMRPGCGQCTDWCWPVAECYSQLAHSAPRLVLWSSYFTLSKSAFINIYTSSPISFLRHSYFTLSKSALSISIQASRLVLGSSYFTLSKSAFINIYTSSLISFLRHSYFTLS